MRFLAALFLLFPILANAGAYSVARQPPVISSGVSGNQAILQVAQPMTFTQGSAANQSLFFDNAANAAQYSLGSGAGSPASNIAKAALGVAGAASALASSPILAGALAVAGVGMAGYDFYQSLKSNGITADSTGSISFVNNPYSTSCGAGWSFVSCYAATITSTSGGACPSNTSWCCPNGGSTYIDYSNTAPSVKFPWSPTTSGGSCGLAVAPTPPVPTAATIDTAR